MTLLAASHLSKSYGGVRALSDVSFAIRPGEIHAVVGENGAGKSTLIKIIGGAVRPDAGDVRLGEMPLPLGDPLAIRRHGVSIVYQELTLVPELTVAENVFLGRERGRAWLRRAEMDRNVQTLLDELGVRVEARARVRGLSMARQQMVEIARALRSDARVLILDEPSAALSAAEVERLFGVLRGLRDRGLGIVYISHRLEEIFALADRVTVLRDGRHVAEVPVAEADRAKVIRWMVGRDLSEEFPPRDVPAGDVLLEVRHLSSPPRFEQVSFDVRAGEIVGLAGLVGAGRTSAALALVGALPARGDVRLDGRSFRPPSPADAIAAGLAYVTEDRKARGLFPLMTAGENITLSFLGSFARFGLLSGRREAVASAAAARDVDLRAARLGQPAATLSGGNQQKALVARFLLRPRRVLILDEPTRGVDVGARTEIYRLIDRLTASGVGIIMISSDLPELLGMSDRIVVMRQGRTVGTLSRGDATAERVMALATMAAA